MFLKDPLKLKQKLSLLILPLFILLQSSCVKDQIIKLDTSRSEIQTWYGEITENQKTEVLDPNGQTFTVKNEVNWKEYKSFKNSDSIIVNFFPVKTDLYKSINRYGKLYLVAYIKNNKVVGKLVNISLNLPLGEILTEPLMQDIYQKSFGKVNNNDTKTIELINYNNFIRRPKSTKQSEMGIRACIATYLVTRWYDGYGTEIDRTEQLVGVFCTGNGENSDMEDNWDPTGFGSTYNPPTHEIHDQLTDPCLSAVVKSAMNSGLNNIIGSILQHFGRPGSSNLTFKNAPSIANGADANIQGRITGSGEDATFSGTITFNDSNLVNASKPYIATLIAHEVVHAYLREETGRDEPFQGMDHDEIAEKYIPDIAGFVSSIYNIPYEEAASIAWRGVMTTEAYKKTESFQFYNTTMSKEEVQNMAIGHLIGGKGNKCD